MLSVPIRNTWSYIPPARKVTRPPVFFAERFHSIRNQFDSRIWKPIEKNKIAELPKLRMVDRICRSHTVGRSINVWLFS